MAKTDNMLIKVCAWAVLLCILAGFASAYMYTRGQYVQARREVEYLKAHQLVAEQQMQRQQQWQRQMQQQQLRRKYNQGRVIGLDGRPVQ